MQFQVGRWRVRPDMNSVVCQGQAHHISPKAMEVLLCLAKRQGQVVGKDQIFKEVWKGTFVSDDSLTRCIGELRRAFQDDASEPTVIQTIAKRGYLLLPPVTWEPDGPSPLAETVSHEPAATPSVSASPQSPSARAGESSTGAPGLWPVWMRRSLPVAGGLIVIAVILLVFHVRKSRLPSPASRAIRSIAVLPLANLSGDPQQEYFADGMTDQLITRLAQLGACDVISRTSVMRYKGKAQPIRDIAHELSVDGLVEGTVLRSGTRVRITAQLIDAATDRHLWAGSFEREIGDVLSLQDEVALRIAGQLNITLDSPQRGRPTLAQKVTPEAYEAYLLGWYFFDRSQYAKAASYFERAMQADPNFALAHALFFEADSMDSFVQDAPFSDRALKAMQKARQLDENLAEAHDAAGDVLLTVNLDWKGAEEEYDKAVELNPGSIDAMTHLLYCLEELTRWQEAEAVAKRALRLDPVSPLTNRAKLSILVNSHRYDLAQQQFRKVIELDPNLAGVYDEMVTVYAALNREDDATTAFLKLQSLSGLSPEQLDELAAAAKSGGYRNCLRKRIEQLKVQGRDGRVSPLEFAKLYARLGDRDQAFKFLEEAYHQHLGRLIWIKTSAVWDPLRPDPRYRSLLRLMRFPE